MLDERSGHTGGVAPYAVDHDNADRLWQISLALTQQRRERSVSVSCIARSSSIGPKPARAEPD
jgi:hypothetical protein